MKRWVRFGAVLLVVAPLGACTGIGEGGGFGAYGLVRAGQERNVGNGGLAVTAPRNWNRATRFFFDNVRQTEDWTLNGPLLDSITFVTGLPDDKALVRQSRRDDQQVPKFRRTMTAPELASMIESAFRVKGGAVDFTMTSLQPRPFLGAAGFQMDFEHLDSDELRRKGRAVGAVIDDKLYLVLIDAAKAHYYAAALPDYESIVATARRRK